jgi:hypothetical protein
MHIKSNAIIALPPAADHSDKEGYFVERAAGKAAIANSAADIPLGVILDGEGVTGRDSIAVAGGFAGTVHVKVSGAVAADALGQLAADGTVVTDAGAGARVIVCRFLEAGAVGELVEAVLVFPDART